MRKAMEAPGLPLSSSHRSSVRRRPAQEPATQRDPESVAALERMGAALRAMDSFAMHADVTREDVLSTGQKIQYSGTLDIHRAPGRVPDRLPVQPSRTGPFINDGQNLTVVAPRAELLRVRPVTGTNGDVVQRAARNSTSTSVADLFTFAPTRSDYADHFRDPIGLETINVPAMPAARHAPGGN